MLEPAPGEGAPPLFGRTSGQVPPTARPRKLLDDEPLGELAELGLPASGLRLASSWSFEVWIGPEIVVHVATPETSPRLARTARLLTELPAESGRPELLGAGQSWMATRRSPGRPLIDAWPSLSPLARRRAIAHLAEMLRALHVSGAGTAPIPTCPDRPRPHTLKCDHLLELIEASCYVPGAQPDLAAAAAEIVDRIPLHGGASATVHCDVHLGNVLWHRSRVTGLVDFEWCRRAPMGLELETLLDAVSHPGRRAYLAARGQHRSKDHVPIVPWLRSDYPELFGHPDLVERLRAFALSRELGDIVYWARSRPEPRKWQLVRELVERRSHLDRLLG